MAFSVSDTMSSNDGIATAAAPMLYLAYFLPANVKEQLIKLHSLYLWSMKRRGKNSEFIFHCTFKHQSSQITYIE